MNAAGQLVAFGTVARREVARILRIWTQTLLPSAITMTLYFVIFGTLIGSRIGDIVPGVGYIDYIVPGLIMMAVVTNSYGNISSSFFSAKFGHYVEEMLASPMPGWILLAGYVAGAVLRGFMVALIVLAISLFFTRIQMHHAWVTLSTIVLTSIVFALAGFINALYAKKFDDVALVPTFLLTPLTYLGGVFYSVDMLGSPWRQISHANPVLYMVNAFRYGLLDISDMPLGLAYAVMLGFVVVLTLVALHLLRRGIGLRS
ncbi:MAG: ABC transporter permease [Dokdonella sp.]|uniref:ABC transporter permease n=1 Tax=Dokdonella sp. TaxID=2291710 RepID=UPI0025B8FACF|nr:ABC transporter permease [Dokdonella sp.]MBX3700479.1 ABC transporter permease [Dokdonella sp.]MCW5578706.1 ABC transporter permease [Dokdonella sp.]